MANVTIFPTRNMNGVQFDCVLSEDHSTELEMTQHAVERGVNFSDHTKKKPKKLTMVVAWSDIIWQKENALANVIGSTKIGQEVRGWSKTLGITTPATAKARWKAQYLWKYLQDVQSCPTEGLEDVRLGGPEIFDI